MRSAVILFLLLIPGWLSAQHKHAFSSPVSNESYLLRAGNNIVVIHAMDQGNNSQKWITFDSTLTTLSAKKLITPGAENIISQNYLEGNNSIIRIDQSIANGVVIVNAFVFDIKGNLVRSKQIETIPIEGRRSQFKPFAINQSANKKIVSLTHTTFSVEQITISALVFDDRLVVSNKAKFSLAYDSKLLDLYSPVVSNDQTLFVPVVDKFKSYKLSGFMHGYVLKAGEESPSQIQFEFERQKVKNLTFQFAGDTLIFSALFSKDKKKGEIAGVLFSGYDLKGRKLQPSQFVFDGKTKADLKKLYGHEGRKGNLLNYLSLVPETFFANVKSYYATLTQDQQTPMYVPRSSPAPLPNLDELRQEQAYINSLVRRTPPGSSRPLNIAEATTYAAINPINTPVQGLGSWKPNNGASRPVSQRTYDKNLLFFNFENNEAANHKFIKLKYADVPEYQFFTYMPAENGYGAIHYVVPNFTKPYLRTLVIDANSTLVSKKIFQDKTKIILPDYPWLVSNGSLVAFYEDRLTRQMGLVKIAL